MKILSPFSKEEEVMSLIEAGADELYCGIVPSDWSSKWGVFDTLNRREGRGANFSKFRDLQYSIQLAHSRKVPVFVTMNGLYTRAQYPLIQRIIKKLKDIKVDGLIITDIGLLLMLQEKNIFKEIHISTGGTTFNSKTVSFYKKLGASRIILPRHLTVNEIKDITQSNSDNINFEVFILNTHCPNVDGFCTFYHGLPLIDIDKESTSSIEHKEVRKRINFYRSYDINYEGHGCELKFSIQIFDNNGKRIMRKTSRATKDKKKDKEGRKECGACAIFDFNKIKIKSLKIVERGAPTENKIRDTKFIREVLDIFNKEKNLSREQFINRTQELYCHIYKRDKCSGFSCYYPDVHNVR